MGRRNQMVSSDTPYAIGYVVSLDNYDGEWRVSDGGCGCCSYGTGLDPDRRKANIKVLSCIKSDAEDMLEKCRAAANNLGVYDDVFPKTHEDRFPEEEN